VLVSSAWFSALPSLGVLPVASAVSASASDSRYEFGSVNLLILRAYDKRSEYETSFVFSGKMVAGVSIKARRVSVRSVRVLLICRSKAVEVSRRETNLA
jgi:hypothetical protein